MATLPNPAEIRYGGFYLPVFSLLYLKESSILPVKIPFPIFDTTINAGNFEFVFGMTLFGAFIVHGATRSIYGIEGAEQHPKHRFAVIWYRTIFLFKREPGKPPKSLEHIVDKIEYSTEEFEELSQIRRLFVIIIRIIRPAIFWPTNLAYLTVAYVSTWALAITAVNKGIEPLGGILLIGQSVFFVGSIVFGRFPSVVPINSVPWLYLAEYHKARLLHDRGEVDFEYGPLDFSVLEKPFTDLLNYEDENKPHYYDQEEVEWTVAIDPVEPEYLVDFDDSPEEKE